MKRQPQLTDQLKMNVPEAVRQCGFCCWKRAMVKGRITKVPFDPKTGRKARTNQPLTFGTFDEALGALGSGIYSGIGILVGSGIAAFDIDHCLDEDGSPDELAASVLGIFKDCYVEVSPSGTGLRGFFSVPEGYAYDRNQYYIKNANLEMYIPGMTNRFVTITGNVYRQGTVQDEQAALEALLEKHMKRRNAVTELPEDFEPHSLLSDEDALEKARKDRKFADCFDGGWAEYFPSQSEADLYVLGCLAFYCGGDMEQMERVFSGSALDRDKFCGEYGLTAYAENTMKKAVAGCQGFYDPEYGRTAAAEDFAEADDEVSSLAEGSDLDVRLDTLLSSKPTVSDLYSADSILLAAYAKVERPADYETLRSFARKNNMRLDRYEKEIRSKEAEVMRRREERMERERIRAAKKQHGGELPSFICYNRRTDSFVVDPALLAIHVKEHLKYILVQDSLRDTRTKYVYEDGVYRLCSDERFKGYIKRFIEDYDPALVRMRDVEEANRNISAGLQAIPYDLLNNDEDIINFRNGILNLKTMELMPHDPAILSTIQLDCDWTGKDEHTPTFDGYMAVLSDYNRPVHELLLQFMGAVLSNVRGSRYKKALFMTGDGDSGKSQLKILTERILGRDNFAAVDLPELESQFGASMIYGRRLAGTADLSFMTIRELKSFKTITGGDNIKIEFKGKTGFSYIYNGFLWFCMNRPPRFGGDNGAWVYDRILLVDCPNVIPKSEQDHELLDKMLDERNGVVFKAVMAFRETVQNGYRFTEPDSITAARADYRAENNSVIQFIQDCLEERETPGSIPTCDHATVSNVHRIYTKWCKYNNNGYAKTLREFKQTYCEYFDLPMEKAVIRRGGGMYLANHEVTQEAYCNLLPTDVDIHRDAITERSGFAS